VIEKQDKCKEVGTGTGCISNTGTGAKAAGLKYGKCTLAGAVPYKEGKLGRDLIKSKTPPRRPKYPN
jgi:hypothetical protein